MNTPLLQSKELKKKLNDLLVLKNKAISAFSFRGVRTLEGFLKEIGYDNTAIQSESIKYGELTRTISTNFITSFFTDKEQQVRLSFLSPPKEVSVQTKDEEPSHLTEVLQEDEKLPPSPSQLCTLFPFQERAASKLLKAFTQENKSAMLLLAPVGTGKTFMIGALVRRLYDLAFANKKTISPWPYVYVTKSSIIAQSERVLTNLFSLELEKEIIVINVEQLRAKFGELFVRHQVTVVNGEEQIKWCWRPGVMPFFMLLDECQILKNEDSQQSAIMQGYNDTKFSPSTGPFQLFSSATPFIRVADAKCFVVATRLKYHNGLNEVTVTNENWSTFAKEVAYPDDPDDYSPPAVDRLMKYLEPYIVQVKGVRSQFNAKNSVLMIEFQNEEERKFYDQAWERYLEEVAKLQAAGLLDEAGGGFMILVQFLKFRMAAELCRAPYLAAKMYEAVQEGKAGVVAVNFKGTIKKIVEILHDKYGVSRELISLIWGGGKAVATVKQKKKKQFTDNPKLLEFMQSQGLSLEDVDVDNVEDYVEEKERAELQLGAQSLKQRQKEIDSFQSGKSLYCLYTFKSGGVGLSLHHTDELTKSKATKKKSGWYVEETIKNVPTRQREVYLAPTYSAIELVQGLGRAPRLTSMSDTNQTVIFYKGTIEEQVATIVSQKLRCLRRVVRARESWESVIIGGVPKGEKDFSGVTLPSKVKGDKKNKKELLTEQEDIDDDVGMFTTGEDEED